MAEYKYSYEGFDNASMAKACGRNLSISLKKTVETAKAIKGKRVSSAIIYLEHVTEQKAVVPFTKYKAEMPHQRGKGIDTGGFPVNVAAALLKLVKSAQKNAKEKELSEENLRVISVSARKGPARYHYGRHSGRKMKATHVEVIVGEVTKKNSSSKKQKMQSAKTQSQSQSEVMGVKK